MFVKYCNTYIVHCKRAFFNVCAVSIFHAPACIATTVASLPGHSQIYILQPWKKIKSGVAW